MKKPLFNKVCIVGVGLIGGSLGIDIKRKGIARTVIGVARRLSTISMAKRKKAIDTGTTDIFHGIQNADLVILATPVSSIKEEIRLIADDLDSKTLVIDVGSSKVEINATAGKYLKSSQFVGCHPMAGSHLTGIHFAQKELFKKSICFVTSRNRRIEAFWQALGAKPIFIRANEHDLWVANMSYLPHVLAFSMFRSVKSVRLGKTLISRLRGNLNPSARDLARLASSNRDMWTQILLSTRRETLKSIINFKKELNSIEAAIKKRNQIALWRILSAAYFAANRLAHNYETCEYRSSGKH